MPIKSIVAHFLGTGVRGRGAAGPLNRKGAPAAPDPYSIKIWVATSRASCSLLGRRRMSARSSRCPAPDSSRASSSPPSEPAATGSGVEATRFNGEKYECGLHLESMNNDFQI